MEVSKCEDCKECVASLICEQKAIVPHKEIDLLKCIGCGLCEKTCKFDAIHVENNIAHIDQSKCKGCGACAAKCPKKVILAH